MIYRIKKYFCDRIPTEEDIFNTIELAKREDCIIELTWYGPAHGFYGDDTHYVMINPLNTVEEILDKLPKIYGV